MARGKRRTKVTGKFYGVSDVHFLVVSPNRFKELIKEASYRKVKDDHNTA